MPEIFTNVSCFPLVVYPDGFDEIVSEEMLVKGWIGPVEVWLDDTTGYHIYFTDIDCAKHDLTYAVKQGHPCFTEPGLVILPSVTVEQVNKTVVYLQADGYFKHLMPLNRVR